MVLFLPILQFDWVYNPGVSKEENEKLLLQKFPNTVSLLKKHRTFFTEQEVLELVNQDAVTKWKKVDLLRDGYYTFEDFNKGIYVLRYNEDGKENILYFRSLEKRKAMQQDLETK